MCWPEGWTIWPTWRSTRHEQRWNRKYDSLPFHRVDHKPDAGHGQSSRPNVTPSAMLDPENGLCLTSSAHPLLLFIDRHASDFHRACHEYLQ
jgi:hypothetical protein